MGPSETKAKRPKRRSRSTAGDAFVVLAMTLTTVALAIGLYLQFRLAFWLAVVAALSVYVGLLALHVLVRRSERVEILTAEIQRLEAELTQVSGGARGGSATGAANASAQQPSAQLPSAPSSAMGSNTTGPSPTGLSPTGPNATGPTAMVPAVPGASAGPALPPAPGTPTGLDAMGARPGPFAVSPPAHAPANAPKSGSPHGPAGTAPEQPSEAAALPPDRAGMSDRAVDAIMNDYWAFRPAQTPRLPDAPAQGAGAATYPSRGPELVAPAASVDPQPRAPMPPPPPMSTAAEARPRAVTPPPVPSTPPPMPSSPRQSDVEMIGGLIKKMADEINAVEADRLRNPAGGDRVPPAAIEASVNALRTTADQMRGGSAPPPELVRAPAPTEEARRPLPPSAPVSAARPEAPVPQRQRSAETSPAWTESAPHAATERHVTERPVTERPVAERHHAERAGAENAAPRAPAAAVTAPHSGPPPLPPRQSAPPPLPARHAMERPAARDLPPPAEMAGLVPLPWPETPDADTAATAMRPVASANQIVLPVDTPAPPPSIGHSRLAALAEAITAGRLDVLLDPILGLVDKRARHFEVSVRLRDKNGNVLEPPDGVPELRESGLLPLLDCARIHRSAQVATRLSDRGKPGSLFSAFSSEALSHDQFLSDFADLYAAREGLSAQLVLSFGQADVRAFTSRDWETIAEMHELGFRFALQSVTDLDFDLEGLKAAGFDFVKLDASVFLDGMPASGGVIPAADICRHLAQLGMTLIVGQIDDEAQMARIFGFGVIYGQGQLFGGARPMKTEALSDAGTRQPDRMRR